jgi:hypothetical protein
LAADESPSALLFEKNEYEEEQLLRMINRKNDELHLGCIYAQEIEPHHQFSTNHEVYPKEMLLFYRMMVAIEISTSFADRQISILWAHMSRGDSIFKVVAAQIVEEAKASLSLEQSKTQEIDNELIASSKLIIHDNPKCEGKYKEKMTS